MCGFVAVINRRSPPIDSAVLSAMTNAIEHRGPDDFGYHQSERVSFGFRRLSILDLSPLGHQPMTSSNGRYTIVFNGEIYNYRELRQELIGLGHQFRSSGDTEVLLTAYQQWGEQFLSRLNGMWAFAIHDHQSGEVFGSRDRFGIKPLFLHESAEGVVLASEIKSIRVCPWYQGGVNERVLAAYLQRGELDESHETFHAGIGQIPPAHAYRIDAQGRVSVWRWWSLDAQRGAAAPGPRLVQDFAELFEDSMSLHMRSDVPVGVNLSGGLDSTSIICAAARLRDGQASGQELLAFSYFDEAFDESPYIAATVAQTGARICRLETSPQELWRSLDEVVRFQDEPVHSMSAVVGNHLMRLARSNGVKVLLNGQGADESLAGYPNYFQDYWSSLLSQGHMIKAWREVGAYAAGHQRDAGSLYGAALKRQLAAMLARLGPYRNAQVARRREAALQAAWLHPDLRRADFAESLRAAPGLKDSLQDSIDRTPLPLYLRVEDRNSMQHSIEARVPFLDYRLVEFAFRCPDSELLNGPWNKHLLRRAMTGRIPEGVVKRIDKMGFPTSFGDWLKDWLHDEARDLIAAAPASVRQWVDIPHALQRLEDHRTGRGQHARSLFNVIQVIKWAQHVAHD